MNESRPGQMPFLAVIQVVAFRVRLVLDWIAQVDPGNRALSAFGRILPAPLCGHLLYSALGRQQSRPARDITTTHISKMLSLAEQTQNRHALHINLINNNGGEILVGFKRWLLKRHAAKTKNDDGMGAFYYWFLGGWVCKRSVEPALLKGGGS